MAIKVRRGLHINFDPNKLLAGEFAVSTDKKVVHIAFAPGIVKRLATYEDMASDMEQSLDEIKNKLKIDINNTIDETKQVANYTMFQANLADEKANLANSVAQQAQAIIDSAAPIINQNLQATYVNKGTDIQGASINFPTSDNGLVHIKKIEGRTDQVVSVQGKNLFDLNRFVSNANTIYSVVNGALVVNATDTRTGTSALYWMKLSANTTYTLKTSEVTGIRIYVKGTTTEVVSVRSDVATFTTNSDSLEYAFKFVESSFPKTINTVQLEQGNTATTYEPFTPNTPSVEYPSPMNYATNIECSTIGKNILDVANPTSKTSDISNVSFNNGVLTLTSANAMGYSSMIYMLDKEKLKGRTITASHGGISASIGNARSIQVEYIVNGTTTYKTFTNGMVTFDVPSNISEIRFKVVTNNTSTATNITETITINNLQIEYGSTKTAYEPFKGYSRITVPFNAMSLPNGVKNTIEYKDGKLYKVDRVKEITLNGLETWTLQETMANTYRFNSVSAYVGAKDNPTEITKRCDKFKCTTVSDVSDTEHIRNPANNNPNTCIIYINKSRISSGDVASFKTWLSANPITIQYELTTPIYEEITPLYLTSYKGVTNVFNSANLPMTLDFKSELWSRDYLQDVSISKKYEDTTQVAFTTASSDIDIASGDTIPTIFGKLKKTLLDFRTAIANKFDKSNLVSSDLINDANKVPTSQITYALGQEIDNIINGMQNFTSIKNFVNTIERSADSWSKGVRFSTPWLTNNSYRAGVGFENEGANACYLFYDVDNSFKFINYSGTYKQLIDNDYKFIYQTVNGLDVNLAFGIERKVFVLNGINLPPIISAYGNHGFLDVKYYNGNGFNVGSGEIPMSYQTFTHWVTGDVWTRIYNHNTGVASQWACTTNTPKSISMNGGYLGSYSHSSRDPKYTMAGCNVSISGNFTVHTAVSSAEYINLMSNLPKPSNHLDIPVIDMTTGVTRFVFLNSDFGQIMSTNLPVGSYSININYTHI